MKIETVRKGESLPFTFDRGDESIAGWTCTIKVKEYDEDTALITKIITPTDGQWKGFLTGTETATLTEGNTYRIVAVLTNATTDEAEQVEARFSLTASWAA